MDILAEKYKAISAERLVGNALVPTFCKKISTPNSIFMDK